MSSFCNYLIINNYGVYNQKQNNKSTSFNFCFIIQSIQLKQQYDFILSQAKLQQKIVFKMQNQLIMNQLPLPKFYDGQTWNTVIKPSRKYIPKYLHQDLPELRHLYIKQIFKSMGKFNCPDIQYFNKMIKPKRMTDNKKNQLSIKKSKTQNLSYNDVKQQLQYALITTDRSSNVIDDLVIKAQKVNQQQKTRSNTKRQIYINSNNFRKRKVATSLSFDRTKKSSTSNKQKYFQKTVDLVFKNRRDSYLQNLKKKNNQNQEQVQKRYEKLNQLKLIDYQGHETGQQFAEIIIKTSRY